MKTVAVLLALMVPGVLDARVLRIEIDPAAEIDVPLTADKRVWISSPAPITMFAVGNRRDYLVEHPRPRTLEIAMASNTVPHPTNLNVELLTGQQLSFQLLPTATEEGISRIELVLPDQPKRERGPLEGRLGISIQAALGAINLVGIDENDWTSLQGIGARAIYGVARHVTIEGLVDYTRAGPSRFPNTTWDQDQGELEVRESAARVLAGALLHPASRRWLPFARLGLGVRASQHKMAMGGRTDTEVRASLLAGVGGGLNILMGQRAMAGVSVLYAAPLGGNDTTSSFEAAASVTALWDL